MVRPLKVSVLQGGWSSERAVSLDSAASVVTALETLGHQVQTIDVTPDIAGLVQQLTPPPDVVFNALHGTGGEDGVIQGLLECLRIPYTHSGVMASALGMHKLMSRQIFLQNGLIVPETHCVSYAEWLEAPASFFEGAYVIKPVSDGSSQSVFIVQKDQSPPDLSEVFALTDQLLIEEYLPGREIQVAVMGDTPLGAIEIRPLTGFYDYVAKYTPGHAEHIMPALLPQDIYQEVLTLGLRAHQVLGCRGVTRSDFIYHATRHQFYLLETNTQPGMTALSLVPEIAAYRGIQFEQLIQWMIENAQCDAN